MYAMKKTRRSDLNKNLNKLSIFIVIFKLFTEVQEFIINYRNIKDT